MTKREKDFFPVFLIVAIAVVFQLKFGGVIGYGYDFALAALIGAAFFVSFLELLVLALFTIFLINWQPGMSIEMLSILILPTITFLGRRILPGKAWFSSIGFLFFGILLFYVVADFNEFLNNFGTILSSALFGVLFGVLVFRIIGYFYEIKENDR